MSSSTSHPIPSLILAFLAWKTLLLCIAAASPGPGYDTSASLVEPHRRCSEALPSALCYLLEKLTRWDAIYFVRVSNRGYVFEQEWAWGLGFTRLVAFSAAGLKLLGIPDVEGLEALAGVLIAHVSHLLSVLILFALGTTMFPSSSPIALTAALLHIISPAGIFLSAPYAESPCALFSFLGILLFVKSVSRGHPTVCNDLLILVSGIIFGIATTFRSNGILNGLLLLEEAIRLLLSLSNNFNFMKFRRLVATVLGGLSVGAGFVIPQYIAWSEYCGRGDATDDSLRPWCRKTVPSVYSFVQEHYWNVGLFRYWTLGNLPLFLLATPMVCVMIVSGLWAFQGQRGRHTRASKTQGKSSRFSSNSATSGHSPILRNMAVSQLLLTAITFTSAHVQIISRISSAYPVWLWYLSALSSEGKSPWAGNFIRFMVMYAIVQAGLYASFLPPA